jgi:hypothetical protein
MDNLEPTNLLDEFMEDFTIHKSKLTGYSYQYTWKTFIRS